MIKIKEVHDIESFKVIESLARTIFLETYDGLIPEDHIFYLLQKSHTTNAIATNISDNRHRYFMLANEQEALGYLGVYFSQEVLVLNQLYILQTSRNLGAGKMALSCAIELAHQAGINTLELTVLKENKAAILFYESQGFCITDSLHHQFDNGHAMNGYKMCLMLKNRK